MYKRIYLSLVCVLCATGLAAHDHRGGHPRNELGISGGAIYCPDHGEWGGSVHIHWFRTFRPESRWAWGASAEQAWTDDGHFTLGAGIKCELLHRLELGLMPGVTFLQGDEHGDHEGSKTRFSVHTEAVYNLIEWKHFHLGPAIDYSWMKGDSHVMPGLHAAYCF